MLSWIVIIVLVVLVIRGKGRIEALEEKSKELQDSLWQMRKRLSEIASPGAAPARSAASPAEMPVTPAVVPPVPTTVAPPVAPPAFVYPPIEPRPVVLTAAAATPPVIASTMAGSYDAPPPRKPRPTAAATPPAPPSEPFDWEQLIGVKLFSWIAGAALALGAVFFLKYSVQQGWLRPEIRMGFGLITGVGLLIACELKAARRYSTTANALDASGIAILFATVYASFALWHLIPPLVAFGLLFLVTGIAVLLSIRRESMFIAVLGLLGGFATPAMLATGQDNPIGLFSYLLLLNAGLAWVAYRKRWPALTALSVIFTTFYQWGWVLKFLTPDKLPLAVGIFLLFPIVTLLAFGLGRSRVKATGDEPATGGRSMFEDAAHLSAALPLIFSLYLAAVPAYGAHYGILFGFVLALAVGLFAIAITQGPKALHFLGALSTVGVFAIWFRSSYSPDAWPWLLAFTAAFVALYLLAPVFASWFREVTFDGLARFAVHAAPLLLFVFPALLFVEPRAAAPMLTFGTLFALVAACAIYAIGRRDGAVHFVAAFFAIVAEAVWSARYLEAGSLYTGLALYGVFGLFYIGTPVLARRLKRPLEPHGVAGVLTLASLALLLFIAAGSVAASALWGMALLIAVLNVGLLGEAAHARSPALSLAGSILSWAILGVWWLTAGTAAVILPALMVMGGFGVLTLVGNTWARGRTTSATDESVAGFDRGTYVGLIGHVFIAFVVTRPELSIPPWPILGVLGVLQVAVLGASLFRKNGALHVASIVATALILALWTTTAQVAPWPQVAVYAAGALALLAFIAIPLARSANTPTYEFELSAGLAVLLGQIVAIFAQMQTGSPALAFLVGAQMVFIVGALAASWIDIEHVGWVTVAAVVAAMTAAVSWSSWHSQPAEWRSHIVFAAPLLLLFIVHPLLLRSRSRGSRSPFYAAVLASAFFFFIARRALILGGHANVIGALPVVQALLLAPVLALLVRLERDRLAILRRSGEAVGIATDRLVLVAGAILAFVTAAIPLQLEKNWITIAWALEGVALLWLCRRLVHPGLIAVAVALFVAVFVRLTLNPAVLSYHPRGAMPILNWYLYTYLVCAVAMFAAARLAKPGDQPIPLAKGLTAAFSAAGTVLLFLLLNIEIADYYSTGPTITFDFNASLAQDLTYTIGWALFAMAMLTVGIVIRNRATRVASIILLVATVLKCFLHDLGRLGGLYRVGSFVGLAISLALVALALQKFVLARNEPPKDPALAP